MTTTSPRILSIRLEHRPSATRRLPGLGPLTSPARDVVLVEVEHFGRQAWGPQDWPRTLVFPAPGAYCHAGEEPLDPRDPAAVEAAVLAAHRADLAAERAGD